MFLIDYHHFNLVSALHKHTCTVKGYEDEDEDEGEERRETMDCMAIRRAP